MLCSWRWQATGPKGPAQQKSVPGHVSLLNFASLLSPFFPPFIRGLPSTAFSELEWRCKADREGCQALARGLAKAPALRSRQLSLTFLLGLQYLLRFFLPILESYNI